jgi:hypothetical protein
VEEEVDESADKDEGDGEDVVTATVDLAPKVDTGEVGDVLVEWNEDLPRAFSRAPSSV